LADDLKYKTKSGLFWNSVGYSSQMIISFAISITLARLLEPHVFGLIAMITVFTSLVQAFTHFGFHQAIIQNQDLNKKDYSTVFFLNLILGMFLTIFFYFSAPLLAKFYEQPIITQLTRVLALNFFFGAFSIVHISLLTKAINFKLHAIISILVNILSGSIGILLAVRGFGVWSLVFHAIATTFFRSLLLWVFYPWRPSFYFKVESLLKLSGFSSKIFFSSILDNVFSRLDNLIIGKLFSPASLGFYSRAKSLYTLPITPIGKISSQVLFPVFSRLQNNKEKFFRYYETTYETIVFLVVPICVFIIITADPIVRVLLTDKWAPTIPMLQILAIAGIVRPLVGINLTALLSMGFADTYLKLEVIKKISRIICILVGSVFGIFGIIVGVVVNGYFGLLLNIIITNKKIGYNSAKQLYVYLHFIIIALCSGLSIPLINWAVDVNITINLIMSFLSMTITYLLIVTIFKRNIIAYLLSNIKI